MIKRLLVAALVSLPLLAGATVVSADSHPETAPPEHGDRVVGVVESEQGHMLTVRTRAGETVAVHWTADTVCYLDGDQLDCDDIAPGQLLVAVGEFAGGSDQFLARVIRARHHVRPSIDRVAGIVERDEGQTLGIRTRSGETVAVHWDESTRCQTREGAIRCESIEPGDRIAAAGRREGDQLFARSIAQLPGDAMQIARVRGVVTASHGQVLAVETADGATVNVHWDADTTCANRDGEIACDSTEAGSRILAAGTELGGNNLDAKRIMVGSAAPVRVRPAGDEGIRGSHEDRPGGAFSPGRVPAAAEALVG